METTSETTKPIDIAQLSPAQKKQMLKDLAAEQKREKDREKAEKKAFKDLAQQFLEKNIGPLITRQESMENLITELFKDYQPILDLKKQVFGAEVYNQESHTITHPDGDSSITIGYNVNIIFDGTESAGIQLIKDFLTQIPGDDEGAQKLAKAVNVLLKPNGKTGMLNPSRVIQLNDLREEFNDSSFNQGVDIIMAAQSKAKSSMYVSGWKFIELEDKRRKKMEFRFTV